VVYYRLDKATDKLHSITVELVIAGLIGQSNVATAGSPLGAGPCCCKQLLHCWSPHRALSPAASYVNALSSTHVLLREAVQRLPMLRERTQWLRYDLLQGVVIARK
jgi:hypothetical protein